MNRLTLAAIVMALAATSSSAQTPKISPQASGAALVNRDREKIDALIPEVESLIQTRMGHDPGTLKRVCKEIHVPRRGGGTMPALQCTFVLVK
jgi:hypothetical protein